MDKDNHQLLIWNHSLKVNYSHIIMVTTMVLEKTLKIDSPQQSIETNMHIRSLILGGDEYMGIAKWWRRGTTVTRGSHSRSGLHPRVGGTCELWSPLPPPVLGAFSKFVIFCISPRIFRSRKLCFSMNQKHVENNNQYLALDQ